MEMPDLPETPTSDIPTWADNQPWDCTTTGVEMVEKQSRLPTTENRQYLHLKVEYAMRFPQLSAQIRRAGKTYRMSLKQIMMSGLIRVDEIARNYCWYYKAEVAFDMRTTPPRPFLSSTLLKKDGSGRRHTTNPFPVPGKGIYRRPDIIIVKDKQDRWPGLAGPDTEGNMHGDNLARLVEVKFPGDTLYEDQYKEYMRIVGRSRIRMTILEIHDCRPEEQQWADQVINVTMKAWQTSGAKYWPLVLYPPIFMPRPPSPPVAARIEPWTNAQIKAAWTEIEHATDMTLDMLKQVDWVQVLTNVAKTVGVILVAVGIGVLVVTLGIPEAIIGAFLLIVRLAISAWGALAAILGTGTAALAAG